MNLYDINVKIEEAFEKAINPESGEIMDSEALEYLNELQMTFEEMTENVLLKFKNLTAEAAALKAEKEALAKRQSTAEHQAEWLKKYIAAALMGEKFKTARVSVSWRKSETVEYTGNVRDLPADCIREREPEVNKTALKDALKHGMEIPGATLVTKNNIQIK